MQRRVLLLSVPVKEFGKSVNIGRSYEICCLSFHEPWTRRPIQPIN